MKQILVVVAAVLLLGACGQVQRHESLPEPGEKTETSAVPEESTVEEDAAEPTQEEINEQIKAEAVEIDFIKAQAAEYAKYARVKATGEVKLKDDLNFVLSTEEGDGHGLYDITYLNTTEVQFEDGDIVTVYGSYDGPDGREDLPIIRVTIIEPVE